MQLMGQIFRLRELYPTIWAFTHVAAVFLVMVKFSDRLLCLAITACMCPTLPTMLGSLTTRHSLLAHWTLIVWQNFFIVITRSIGPLLWRWRRRFYLLSGCRRLLLMRSGCSRLLLMRSWCRWLLHVRSGCRWLLLRLSGCRWLLLKRSG